MTHDDLSKSMACLLAWIDGKKNGTNGMLAILHVIKNREKSGWSDGNWVSIVWDELDKKDAVAPDTRDPDFCAIIQHVDGVYSGEIRDNLTNGALYYYDSGEIDLLQRERCATVGTLVLTK